MEGCFSIVALSCPTGRSTLAGRLTGSVAFGHYDGRILARGDLTLQEAEKQLIIRALKETEGNRTLAARKLGMSRRNLHRKLHKHQLESH